VPDEADALLAVAELGPLDELQHARVQRLRAQIAFARNRGNEALPLLLDAATRLVPLAAGLARDAYLEALAAAIFAGRLSTTRDTRAVGAAASVMPRCRSPPDRSTCSCTGWPRPSRRATSRASPRCEQRWTPSSSTTAARRW
jgi:hypothetical protein